MGPQVENNFEEDDIGFELDTDIGLPPLAPSLPNGSHTLLPPSVLGEEEDNIVLPIPNRNDQNHSGPIYSQEVPSFAEVQSAKWAAQKATFKEFCEELVYTLASKSTGYTKLDDIKADLNKDSGWIPDRVVYDLGFQTFENFMNSEQVTRYVEVKMYEGQPCYVPRNTSMFSHIRDEQLIADDAELSKEERAEREKYSRALLPQNCEQFIKGKKTILKLLYELGGDFDPTSQRKGVLWQQIQQKYREETGKELAGEELKKMFQRDKALKIISTLFAQEIEILETTTQGQFYLRFKRPYEEIKAKFEETLRLQREGAKSLHSNRPVPKFADKCVPTGPRYPNVDPELFTEKEEKSNNNSGIATDHKRNKFDLPGTNDQVAGKKQKLADFMGPPTLSNAPTSSSRIDWDDGNGIVTSVPIYQGEGNSGKKDGRINSAGSSKNTKVGYTTRINGEYTDSSSEESDDTVGGDEFGDQRKPTKPGKAPAQTAYQFSDAEESVSNERKDFQQHVSNSRKSVPDQIGTPKQQQTGVARPKFQSYAEKATRLEQRRNAPDNAETTIAHSAQVTNRQRMESTTDEEETGVGKSEFSNKHVQKREVRPQIVGPRPNNTNTTRTVQSSMAFGASSSSIGFSLMDNVNELVRLADKFGVAHETRVAEGSFIFRKNDEFLVLTECTDEKIRISWHKTGRISRESYFMKTNTSEIFVFTIGGILYKHFECESFRDQPMIQEPSTSIAMDWGCPPKESNGSHQKVSPTTASKVSKWDSPPSAFGQHENVVSAMEFGRLSLSKYAKPLPKSTFGWKNFEKVPRQFQNANPPNPAYRRTMDGRGFLAFFTKIYAFSNHYSTNFRHRGVDYVCSEQFYMYEKASHFGFEETANKIMQTRDASTIKRLGNANTLRERLRLGLEPSARKFDHEEWRGVKLDVMRTALREKFTQNMFFFNMILNTGHSVLVEASPSDEFWGVGCHIDSPELSNPAQWRGENWLGRLLMELREEFQQNARWRDQDQEEKDEEEEEEWW